MLSRFETIDNIMHYIIRFQNTKRMLSNDTIFFRLHIFLHAHRHTNNNVHHIISIFSNIINCVLYRTNVIPVYNLTQHNLNPITWEAVMAKGREETMKNPFELMLWYPTGSLTSNRFLHTYKVICYHWIPAYLIDGILFLLGQKRL